MTPQARFNEFLKDIEPSKTTKSNAASAYKEIRDFLRNHEEFGKCHVRTFLSGSYKRDTAIRPVAKNGEVDRPDVDVIVVTNHTLYDNPEGVVDQLYNALKGKYPDIRRQARSVGIKASKADMDIVPVIEPYGEGGTMYIPDRKQVSWLVTNPAKHTEWTISTNKMVNGRFKPLVKMIKWWRRENPTISKQPKGFVIECITAQCMDYSETHYGELFVKTLESIVKEYYFNYVMGAVPFIPDPGVPGSSVTDGMSVEAFKGFYNKAKIHAEIGRKAMQEEDQEKATVLWRKIFGNRFPSSKTTADKSESLLGAAIRTGNLSFPDRQVKPRKPQGFA